MEKLADSYSKMKEQNYFKDTQLSPEVVERQVKFMEQLVNLCNEHVESDGLVVTLEAIKTLKNILTNVHGIKTLLDILKECVGDKKDDVEEPAAE